MQAAAEDYPTIFEALEMVYNYLNCPFFDNGVIMVSPIVNQLLLIAMLLEFIKHANMETCQVKSFHKETSRDISKYFTRSNIGFSVCAKKDMKGRDLFHWTFEWIETSLLVILLSW